MSKLIFDSFIVVFSQERGRELEMQEMHCYCLLTVCYKKGY